MASILPTLIAYVRSPLPPLASSLNLWLQGEDTKIQNAIDSLIAAIQSLYTDSGSTVAKLPAASASLKGVRTFATDASSPTFGSQVVGGGSTFIPVYCDGQHWMVG